MGYRTALEAAGAEVHLFERFGSYDGDWFAKVSYRGRTGWVHGVFGSCDICDCFLHEFGYERQNKKDLVKFGRRYLDEILTQEEAERIVEKNAPFSVEDDEALTWLKQNKLEERA